MDVFYRMWASVLNLIVPTRYIRARAANDFETIAEITRLATIMQSDLIAAAKQSISTGSELVVPKRTQTRLHANGHLLAISYIPHNPGSMKLVLDTRGTDVALEDHVFWALERGAFDAFRPGSQAGLSDGCSLRGVSVALHAELTRRGLIPESP